jgi:HAD superfamily hydrolase (TIGR01509 family)
LFRNYQEMIEAVFWDLDDTLALTSHLYFQANQVATERFGIHLPDTFREETRGMSGSDVWRHLRKKYGLKKEVSEGHWKSVQGEEFRKLLPQVNPRPRALETWQSVQSLRIVQGVVTNGNPQATTAKLKTLGIYSENLAVISGDDVRFRKPHREPYRRAAEKLKVNPRNCVVIEDSPLGARSGLVAGMRVIGWGTNSATVFPKGTATIGPEESPLAIIQQWHNERRRPLTIGQTALRIQLGLQGTKDRGQVIGASVSVAVRAGVKARGRIKRR